MRRFWFSCIIIIGLLLSSCSSSRTRATSTISFLRPALAATVQGAPGSVSDLAEAGTPETVAMRENLSPDLLYPPPQATSTHPPGTTPVSTPVLPYPPPRATVTQPTPLTPAATSSPPATPHVTGTVIPTGTSVGTPTPLGTPAVSPTVTPSGTVTATYPLSATAVERLPELAGPPPAEMLSTVTIWHSWNEAEVAALWTIIGAFQETYPNVGFDLMYVPEDELQDKFASEVYLGGGPSILLAPAEWGPGFVKSDLLVDFEPYVNPDFLATLNPAAVGTGRYQGKLISLPYALRGVLMYRNQSIISQPAATYDQLVALSHTVTRVGAVGAAIDRGIYFTGANLEGLGGRLMDENGNPAFDNAIGVQWLDLLKSFDQLGVTNFNSNRDRQLFVQEKAGIILETSDALDALRNAVGSDNLAIDPWPSYGEGHLSGYVLADSVYLNANLSGVDLTSALEFTGYFLAPEVQALLAEVGQIPSGLNVHVRDRLIQQAMTAFTGGETFPINPEAQVYWTVLESALLDVFSGKVDAATALQQASDVITERLAAIRK